jgi:hypothetical protein
MFKQINLLCLAFLFAASFIVPIRSDAFEKTAARLQPKEYQTYTNARYQFAVDVPKNWKLDKESDNGDGVSINTGDPSVDIRVFASPCINRCKLPAQKSGFKKQIVKLANLQTATVYSGLEDGKMVYAATFFFREIEYTFFSKTPRAFFRVNKINLERATKSLRVLQDTKVEKNK